MLKQAGMMALRTLALALALGGCALELGEDVTSPEDPRAAADAVGVVRQDLGEATCGHSICETGPALSQTCDTCVVNICSQDPFCCNNSWDSICVDEVASVCGLGAPPISPATVVSSINVRVTTGGDDLFGGSQAYGKFQPTGGPALGTSLNGGAGFPHDSVRNAVIDLAGPHTLGSLTSFTLTWDGAPRELFRTYDNWDNDQLRFFLTRGGPGRCPNFLGVPLAPGRMTGSRTIFTVPVHFP